MTDRHEILLEKLVGDVASLEATREEAVRQTESLCQKIDSLHHTLYTMWDDKFERLHSSMANFSERIGYAELEIRTMKTQCDAHSQHRDGRIHQLFEIFEKHDKILQQLLQIEHTRKGRTAVIATVGAFAGTILGGMIVALFREVIAR